MPKITWLGDDPCVWNEVTFQPGVPVETDDAYMIGKARHNPFFKLEDAPEVQSVFGPAKPEMWTNDYLPEPDPPKRKRGRPPKVRHDVDQ